MKHLSRLLTLLMDLVVWIVTMVFMVNYFNADRYEHALACLGVMSLHGIEVELRFARWDRDP